MRAPDGISDWTRKRFRQWVGVRVETHSDELERLLKIVAGQNKIISRLRRNQEILIQRVDQLTQLTRPGSTDFAAKLAELASDNEH